MSEQALRDAVLEMNSWHPTAPLLLVLSRQRPGREGEAHGNTQAVREVYDRIFGIHQIGIDDPARKFYLHLWHGRSDQYPYGEKKPTTDYGKKHQRIIKDTFSREDKFLKRLGTGHYKLRREFKERVLAYLGREDPIDLRPLLVFYYWDGMEDGVTYGDLWRKFRDEFGVDSEPFSEIFTCSRQEDPVPLSPADVEPPIRAICLPHEFGEGTINAEFWKRFRSLVEERLLELKWQGDISTLVAGITSALATDHALFLLGDPGTGKSTIVTDAIVPALRDAHGGVREIQFHPFTITPHTTQADLFGFQGLDGDWIMGPLGKQVLRPYERAEDQEGEEGAQPEAASELDEESESLDEWQSVPHLIFLDEVNRVDAEALLSPAQAAFDRMQGRKDPGTVILGNQEYVMPSAVFRVFAGNSPAHDIGRREQSRPFKRRFSVVVPPDPMAQILSSGTPFRKTVGDLLERASKQNDPHLSAAAISLSGHYQTNPDSLESLRVTLAELAALPPIAVTVGLLESLLLRAATHHILERDKPMDAALVQTMIGLVQGPIDALQEVRKVAQEAGFTQFASSVGSVIELASSSHEVDPLL